MNARQGRWTIPQWLLDLDDRVKALEESQVTLYEHNIQMMVASGAAPVASTIFTVYTNSAIEFTGETILTYLSSAKSKSASGTFSGKVVNYIVYIEGGGYNVGFIDGTSASFNAVLAITDTVLPVLTNI